MLSHYTFKKDPHFIRANKTEESFSPIEFGNELKDYVNVKEMYDFYSKSKF